MAQQQFSRLALESATASVAPAQDSQPAPRAETAAPTWSTSSLNDFILALDAYEPTIPVEVTAYYMKSVGVSSEGDPRIVKLLSLAADKFLAETIHEAKQAHDLRALSGRKRHAAEGAEEVHLAMEDIERSYFAQGIHQRREKKQ